MRALLPLILCLVLAGCYFTSAEPLFPEARGQCPFPGAVFETIQADPEQGRLPEGPNRPRLTFAARGGYCLASRSDAPQEAPAPLLFIAAGRNAWIVQSEESGYVYFLARQRGERLLFLFPDCDHFSASRLRRLGVVTEDAGGRTTCRANDPAQIEALFRSWIRGAHAPAQVYRLERAAGAAP